MKHHDPAAIRRARIIRTIMMVLLCVISLLPFYLMFVNGYPHLQRGKVRHQLLVRQQPAGKPAQL